MTQAILAAVRGLRYTPAHVVPDFRCGVRLPCDSDMPMRAPRVVLLFLPIVSTVSSAFRR